MNIASRDKQFLSLVGTLQASSRPTAFIFDTPGDLIEGVFGPQQHDHHCLTRKRYLWLEPQLEARRRALGIAMTATETATQRGPS